MLHQGTTHQFCLLYERPFVLQCIASVLKKITFLSRNQYFPYSGFKCLVASAPVEFWWQTANAFCSMWTSDYSLRSNFHSSVIVLGSQTGSMLLLCGTSLQNLSAVLLKHGKYFEAVPLIAWKVARDSRIDRSNPVLSKSCQKGERVEEKKRNTFVSRLPFAC